MARLIIVAGASGAGKTFLLEQLANLRNDIVPIKKFSTRPHRLKDIDIIPECEIQKVNKCEFTYSYCGHFYGIKKAEIDESLKQNKNPIVIVASCAKIAELKRIYHDMLVLYVQNVLSGDDLRRQPEKYRDPVELDERLSRQAAGLIDYISFFDRSLFDYVLLNNFTYILMQQIQYILDKEINNGSIPNYVFVVMPFKDEFDEIYESIKFAGNLLKERELRVERVSEEKGDMFDISKRIETCIEKAGLIICDVTERNPNVYYEFGYAKAKNKPIILIAKNGTELPFDVRQYRTIMYKSAFHLQELLRQSLLHHYSIKE